VRLRLLPLPVSSRSWGVSSWSRPGRSDLENSERVLKVPHRSGTVAAHYSPHSNEDLKTLNNESLSWPISVSLIIIIGASIRSPNTVYQVTFVMKHDQPQLPRGRVKLKVKLKTKMDFKYIVIGNVKLYQTYFTSVLICDF
jgi:hypothetical protein